MIVALASLDQRISAAPLARALAALRASDGSRVTLRSPRAADPRQPCDDELIDASDAASGGDGSGDGDAALRSAGVIVLLLRPEDAASARTAARRRRIQRALEANPHAVVLVALAHRRAALSPHEVGAILVFVAQMGVARLADMLVLDGRDDRYRTLHCPAAGQGGDGAAMTMAEVRHLYRQVFYSQTAATSKRTKCGGNIHGPANVPSPLPGAAAG